MKWSHIHATVQAGTDLSPDATRWAMEQILAGETADEDLASFLMGLRAKGESADEVSVLVAVMLEHANRVDVDGVVLDVVGTGGDNIGTVNISTMAALVCAAAGATVVKHGNRAASSKTGTADVLEALDVRIDLSADAVASSVRETGMGFCFAPMHHPAMRHAVAVRKSLGVPTVFNILGPLSNPAGAQAALIGSSNLTLAPVMAQALADRGVRALVVRGDDGLDEISIAAATVIWDATSGNVIERRIDVRDLGIAHHPIELLIGGEADVNAALLRQALGMADVEDASRIDAIRDAVLVNAAGGLVAYDIACGAEPIRDDVDFIARMHAGVERARTALLSGAAGGLLQRWSAVTKELAS